MKKGKWTALTALALAAVLPYSVSAQDTDMEEVYATEVYEEDVDDTEVYVEAVWNTDGTQVYAEDVEDTGGEWKSTYLDAICSQEGYRECSYALIYVDDDDIPELLCYTGVEAGGCQVYTWHNGVLDVLQTTRLGYSYIESANLFNNCAGHMGVYYDMIFTIENGMWTAVADGQFTMNPDGTEVYTWNSEDVTKEEYEMMLDDVYDTQLAQTEEYYYTYDELCSVLSTGGTVSEGHRYEVVRKNVTWSEAQEECEAKGGYLAALTSQEEFDYVSGLIKQAGCQGCSIWVGGSQKYSTRSGYYWITPEGEYDMINPAFLSFWLDGEPSYRGLTESGAEVEEDSVAMLYIKNEDRFYLNDAPDDILQAAPSYAGIIAYVCEYD